MRSLIAMIAAAALLAGCGGSSHSSSHSSRHASRHFSSRQAHRIGVAAGNAFDRYYGAVKIKGAYVMAVDFRLWVEGGAVNGPARAPASALSPAARHAAAAVVIAFAQKLVREGQLPATVKGGQRLRVYLRDHGVK